MVCWTQSITLTWLESRLQDSGAAEINKASRQQNPSILKMQIIELKLEETVNMMVSLCCEHLNNPSISVIHHLVKTTRLSFQPSSPSISV